LEAAVTETFTPRRVEASLLVVEDFVDSSGFEWRAGDRAPLARRGVREAAVESPHRFRLEFETLPFDPEADRFRAVIADYERRYQELKRRRDGAEERRQKALREEMKEQQRGQPELERRFKKQEREREEQAQRARERFERERIERELEFGLGPQVSTTNERK
jgi:hypothetical protein